MWATACVAPLDGFGGGIVKPFIAFSMLIGEAVFAAP